MIEEEDAGVGDSLHEVDVDGLVAQAEGVDEFRFRVGEEGIVELLAGEEVAPDGGAIVADGQDIHAELADVRELLSQLHELGFAVGSPIGGADKQEEESSGAGTLGEVGQEGADVFAEGGAGGEFGDLELFEADGLAGGEEGDGADAHGAGEGGGLAVDGELDAEAVGGEEGTAGAGDGEAGGAELDVEVACEREGEAEVAVGLPGGDGGRLDGPIGGPGGGESDEGGFVGEGSEGEEQRRHQQPGHTSDHTLVIRRLWNLPHTSRALSIS